MGLWSWQLTENTISFSQQCRSNPAVWPSLLYLSEIDPCGSVPAELLSQLHRAINSSTVLQTYFVLQGLVNSLYLQLMSKRTISTAQPSPTCTNVSRVSIGNSRIRFYLRHLTRLSFLDTATKHVTPYWSNCDGCILPLLLCLPTIYFSSCLQALNPLFPSEISLDE